jgi:hypothetical protein
VEHGCQVYDNGFFVVVGLLAALLAQFVMVAFASPIHVLGFKIHVAHYHT